MRLSKLLIGLQIIDCAHVLWRRRRLFRSQLVHRCGILVHRQGHAVPLGLLPGRDLERRVEIGDALLNGEWRRSPEGTLCPRVGSNLAAGGSRLILLSQMGGGVDNGGV